MIFLAAILLIDVGLYFIVIRRLGKISHYADRISQGEMDLEQLPVRGNDEVAQVTPLLPSHAHQPEEGDRSAQWLNRPSTGYARGRVARNFFRSASFSICFDASR